MPTKQYWLMKSEPDAYSIDDLEREGKTAWEGVRNYQSRNFMRDSMRVGDGVLFYHSSVEPIGVAGVGRVASPSYPDRSALDPKSQYFEPKATPDNPIWMLVDVAFVERFAQVVKLEELKADPSLERLMVCKRGARLSIQPVSPEHFRRIVALGRRAAKKTSKARKG